MAKKMGRPTKYRPEYCQGLINHMAEGKSFETYAAIIGVHRYTLYTWADTIPDFSEAKKKATELCLLWWEQQGRDGMRGRIRGFIPAVWIFSMKNRFHWTDSTANKDQDKDAKPFKLAYTLKDEGGK